MTNNQLEKDFLKYNGKSMPAGIFLALLFGPVGLFYTSTVLAIVMIVAFVSTIPTGFGPVAVWAICLLMQIGNVSEHNKKTRINMEMKGFYSKTGL